MKKPLHVLLALMLLTSSLPVSAQDAGNSSPQPQPNQPPPTAGPAEIDISTPSVSQPSLEKPAAPRPPTILPEEAAKEFVAPVEQPFPGAQCKENFLSPQESNNLFNLLKDGFVGNELSGDADPSKTDAFRLGEKTRGELENKSFIHENPAKPGEAVQVEVPSKKIEPYEVSNWVNSWVTGGPFAFILVLSDTVRTGRCADANSSECFLVGRNLKLRNDGSGILADARPIKELGQGVVDKIKGIFADPPEKSKLEFSDSEQEILAAGFFNEIDDDLTVKTAQRLEKELIANSMLTKDFEAKMGTNCISDDCVISTYSMFDKYFNQWMSAEMVGSVFGPNLLYQSKKLFGWVGRRGTFLRGAYDNYADLFRANFEGPDSLIGKIKLQRMQNRIDKHGWKGWYQDMMTGTTDGLGYPFIKTTEFQNFLGKMQEKGGFLDSIDTLEKKAEFVRVVKDLRTYARASEYPVRKAEERYQNVVNALTKRGISNPNEHPEARKALIDYGRSFGKLIEDFDDDIGLDGPDWFVRHPNTGFYNKGVLQVNTGEVIDLFQEHRNFRIILNKFVDSGDFKNFENELHLYRSVYGTDGHGNLLIYSFDPSTAKSVGHLDYAAGLEHAANNISNVWAKLDNGESIRVTPQSLKFIQSRVTKNIELFQGNWSPVGVVTPEEFASRIANGRVRSNFTKAGPNMDQMLDMLRERNWISRRYFNALDKLMAQEDELLRTYFTVRGGLKWTAYPFTYWWAKKGFGAESISFYQVPDTWSDILIKHGTEKIFDYSYIDFFANAGSDQGDMFVQVLNYLPWEVIYEQLVENFAPDSVAKLYKQLTGEQMRNEVENIAFYLTGPSNCANCFLKIESDGEFKNFRPFFVVKNTKLSSYILEDTQSTAAKEKGQTLIAFAHKMNLEGKSGGAEGEPIDLVEAERNESKPDEEKPDVEEEVESCKEAIKSLPGYSTANKILSFINLGLPEDEKIAAVLGGAQTLTYGVFFWPGIFSSVLVQTVYAPKLHGCIDTKEGYFVHYFLGAKKEEKVSKEGNKVELSTEKFSNLATKLKDSLFGPFEGDTDNAVQQNTQKLIGEVNKLVKNAEENRVVQAKLDVSGTTAAQLKGINLSYIWCGPGCQRLAGQYRLEGRETVEDKNSKKKIDFNFKNGTLTENGKALVSNPDAVRLSALNTTIPAHEIPNRLYEMCIEPTKEVAIEISANGVANVRSLGARQCLSDAVANQTGLPIGSPDRLSDSFGLVQSVSTVTHPNISFLGDQIIAEGVPRKIAAGAGASLKILNNRKSSLSHSNDGVTDTGTVKAVQFENGQLIVLPNGCYSVWLRHHNGAILNQEDVTGLKPKLTSSYNEETQCEEPALELSALANPESSFLRGKVENFNTSLQKMGPFQIFETPAKRYVLYAEKDEKGECRDHLKVIDKETGKVEDFVGKVSATSDGVKITTPDGREHSLDFSAPNGVPQVSFDDKKPEILTSAQGKNGSFYYDPNTGLWYAENAQLLPLIEAFREGIATKVGPNNTTTSTASGNVLNLQFDEDKGGLLNLPSLPENKWLLLAFAGALLLAITVVRIRFSGKNLNAKN